MCVSWGVGVGGLGDGRLQVVWELPWARTTRVRGGPPQEAGVRSGRSPECSRSAGCALRCAVCAACAGGGAECGGAGDAGGPPHE